MTSSPTIAILSTGDMGSAVGRVLLDNGAAVVTCLDGRSERTCRLARENGIEDFSLHNVVAAADLIVSIIPPAEARNAARRVAAAATDAGLPFTYVDANAVSPATAHAVEAIVVDAGGTFVDGSIIGPPPRTPGHTRIYVSGAHAAAAMALNDFGLDVRLVSDRIADASALKMTYAAHSKGRAALMTQLAVAARALGVDEHLRAELELSSPDELRAMERSIPALPVKARRWVGEMLEISQTFGAVGLDPRLFEGAASTFEFVGLSKLADETPETRDRSRTMEQTVEELSRHLAP